MLFMGLYTMRLPRREKAPPRNDTTMNDNKRYDIASSITHDMVSNIQRIILPIQIVVEPILIWNYFLPNASPVRYHTAYLYIPVFFIYL